MAGGPDCENDKLETIEKKPVVSEKPKKSKTEKAIKKLEKAEKKKLIDEDTKAAVHKVKVEADIKEAKAERKAAKKTKKASPLEKVVKEMNEDQEKEEAAATDDKDKEIIDKAVASAMENHKILQRGNDTIKNATKKAIDTLNKKAITKTLVAKVDKVD